MLIDFRFKNYKCFRDEQILSFVANNKDKHDAYKLISPHTLSGINLLPSLVIYGANAAGKTTVLDALAFCQRFVRASTKYEPHKEIPVKPFLLDESSTNPSEFEFNLVIDGIRYQYGFAVNRTKVLEEWLISYPKGRPRHLFHRKVSEKTNENTYSFSAYLKGPKEKIREVTGHNALFLSIGATIFRQPELLKVYDWFSENLHGTKARHLDPAMFLNLVRNEKYISKVRNMIRIADFGIMDISVAERDIETVGDDLPDDAPPSVKAFFKAFQQIMEDSSEDLRSIQINTKHEGNDGKQVTFSLDDESAGTQQYLALSFPILSALQNGHVLFVDELNNSLHPLLVRRILDLFHDPSINTKGAQLLFNTHDTTLLNLSIFRRDQIWFVEKDKKGVSHLYSLLDFSPRKNEALEKGYLQGRYGAIPFLGSIVDEEFSFG